MTRLAACLAALLLLAPLPGRAADLSPNEAALYAAAKGEGEITWYVAQYSGEVAQAMVDAFAARYPGRKANYVRATGGVVFQRVTQDLKAGVHNCDVFSSSVIAHTLFLKDKGLLLKFTPENAAKLVPGQRDNDPEGFYTATLLSPVVIAYNTDKVKGDDIPKRWTDLADPKWKKKLGLAHPAFGGANATWTVMMRKLYGWEFLEKLAKNDPLVGRSIFDMGTVITSGERLVSTASLSTVLTEGAKGNPISFVYPEDGTVIQSAASGILKDTKSPNTAKLFMEFYTSVEGSQVIVKGGGEPLRPEVKLPPPARPLAEIKSMQPTIPDIVKGVPEVIEQWRDTFGS